MKAAPDQQRQLLDLADLDAEIARARHQLKNLPEDAALARLDADLEKAREDVAAAQVAVDNLDREYANIEAEVTGMAEHARRDQEKLASGALSHKAMSDMQHELTGLARRQENAETELLEVMEQQEATGAEYQRAQATVLQLETERTDAEGARRAAAVTLDDRLEDLGTRRSAVTAEVPDDLLGVYEKLRSQGKVGAGLLRARRCGACRMELDPRTLAGIAAAADDAVLRCEECGAILVRTNESGLTRPVLDE